MSRPLVSIGSILTVSSSFPLRDEVERSNTTRMSRLTTQEMTFKAVDGGIIPDGDQKEKMLANFMAPKFLKLRINAQVMLIKNVDDTLVNGSMGRIVKFMDSLEYAGDPAVDATGVIGNQKAESSAAGKKAAVSTGTQKMYPVVEFMLPNGGHRTVMVTADVFKVELPNGECQVSRTQVRLQLEPIRDRGLIPTLSFH